MTSRSQPWETILSEIIVGDAFGVDRMDYLYPRLASRGCCLRAVRPLSPDRSPRILPSGDGQSGQPTLGVEEGGLHSAEALLLARYYMYSQCIFANWRSNLRFPF